MWAFDIQIKDLCRGHIFANNEQDACHEFQIQIALLLSSQEFHIKVHR